MSLAEMTLEFTFDLVHTKFRMKWADHAGEPLYFRRGCGEWTREQTYATRLTALDAAREIMRRRLDPEGILLELAGDGLK